VISIRTNTPFPSQELKEYIREEYQNDQTNYPAADGMPELRESISNLLRERGGLNYAADEILVAGGARPLIYSIFRAIVDPGDTVVFATPSWNNNHYTYLNSGKQVIIEATPERNFMPSAADIKPHIHSAALLALCSPQNPTGTVFTREGLEEICDMVLEENKRRGPDAKPLYLMYDQIYWALTYGEIRHYDPVSLRPAIRNYTVYVDGISKSLAATGVRIGWSMGPKYLIGKMKSILTHVGAWAPKAEQLACARFLGQLDKYDLYVDKQKKKINATLQAFYKGIQELKNEGFRVDAIPPQAAIYLTVQFSLQGMKTNDGKVLADTAAVTHYLLEEAQLAIVPFYAFGAMPSSTWYRLSVGTCKLTDAGAVVASLRAALKKLS
jgi:aspartate aminotransferase